MLFDADSALFVSKLFQNRNFRSRILLASLLLALCASSPILAAQRWKLTEDLGGKTREIRTQLKVEGTMRINPDGKKVRTYPMTLDGKYVAFERNLSPAKSVRYYREAEADSTANDKPLVDKLPTVKRLIVVDASGDQPILFSPEFTLSREELDLVNIPGNPAILATLLPGQEVEIGQTWSPDNQALAQILGIDAVNNHEVTGTLTDVDANHVAKISLQGKISGAIQGVATEIELKARLNLDIRNKAITWFAASIHEDRSIGHALPGFDTTAVVRTQILPSQPMEELADAKLAKLSLTRNPGSEMLSFDGEETGFRVLYPRDWFAMAESQKQTVFRMVGEGELIAQANVNRLTNLKPGEQMTLEAFQEEVKKALKERLGQVVDASQAVNSQGLRELRVTAVGTANSMPITWIYYLVSDDAGKRYSTVFTFETDLAEKFGQADRSFMSGFDLIESKQPTVAVAPTSDEDTNSGQQR
ncbi:hypothetical protein GC197_10365 [bacterium]|nr:hypothetical protein [bacterium]